MKKKRLSILLLSSVLALTASAQKIVSQQATVQCGQVKFRNPVTAEFQLKNEGSRDLVIRDVRKSCGCVSVEYPKDAIPAGATFLVKATYDSKQMGTFNKQVGLYTNASSEPVILTMQGRVVGEITTFSGEYPYLLGELKSDAQELEFDDVNRGDRPVQRIHILNPTDQVMEPVVMHLPDYLQAVVSPSKLAPHHAGMIVVSLDSKKLRDLGLNQTAVYLGGKPGEKVAPDKEIAVSAVLLPDFKELTEAERANAPKIKVSATNLDLGTFSGKKKLKGEIIITNEGKSTLDISNMQVFTVGLNVALNKRQIAPGEMAKLKVTAVAEELKKARSRKPRLLMITNDPGMPKVVIQIQVK